MSAAPAPRPTPARRTRARRYALQALYQWDLSGADLNRIEVQFHEDEDFSKVDTDYFHELLHGVPAHLDELDALYRDYLDRPVGELDPVERALLRLAVYELAHRLDIPYRVVINEAVNLGKKFGAEQAHKYVNGVLDRAARALRPVEHPAGEAGGGLTGAS